MEAKMKNTKLRTAVQLVLVAAIASPTAFADDSYWYLGLGIGAAKGTIDNDRVIGGLLDAGFTTTSLFNDTRENAGKAFGGYQFNRNFAVEGGYYDLGGYSFTATTAPPGTLFGYTRLTGINLDLIGFIPVTERFSIFGRAGAARTEGDAMLQGTGAVNVLNASPSERGTNLKVGLGLQYHFTDYFTARVETERYRVNDGLGNKGDIDVVSLDVIYRFGQRAAPVVARPVPVAPAPTPVAPPAPAPVPTEQYCGTLDINFDINKHDIQLADHEKLRAIAEFLRQFPTVSGVIAGHTDNVGTAESNMRLSQRRADSVVAHLVSVHGIASSRLRAVGYGESRPVADNATQSGMRQNRRIEADFACATGVRGIELHQARETIPLEIEFAVDSAAIDARHHDGLRRVADFLKANPEVRTSIEGHGANGTAERSMEMSRLRAQAVANYLVETLGIARSRVSTEAFGETRRDAYNTSASGRQDNRRVSVILVYPR